MTSSYQSHHIAVSDYYAVWMWKIWRVFYILWVTCHRSNVPSWVVGILWVRNFSRRYFISPKLFLVGIWWIQYFFLVGISWVNLFYSWLISCFKDFRFLAVWERVTKNRNTNIHLKPRIRVFYSKSILIIVNSVYTEKVFHLLT